MAGSMDLQALRGSSRSIASPVFRRSILHQSSLRGHSLHLLLLISLKRQYAQGSPIGSSPAGLQYSTTRGRWCGSALFHASRCLSLMPVIFLKLPCHSPSLHEQQQFQIHISFYPLSRVLIAEGNIKRKKVPYQYFLVWLAGQEKLLTAFLPVASPLHREGKWH